MDFPHEGKYNVQIQMHLYSFVKQLLFQHLKSSCSGGEVVGEKMLYQESRPTHSYCKPELIH